MNRTVKSKANNYFANKQKKLQSLQKQFLFVDKK